MTAISRKNRTARKIAIVHEWLVTYAGSERVLAEMIQCFPEADLFCVVDFLNDEDREKFGGRRPKTTFIQKLPFANKKYRSYLPLMPLAIEQFDLSEYDLILSSSHAVAKGVITGPNQLHVCYTHTPMRYAWDLQHQYLQESNLQSGFKSWLARFFLHKIRLWDIRTANGVDYFISNSRYVARRIRKVYRRRSDVIYPPVETEAFSPGGEKEEFYLTASRMVPYKKIPLIVEAFSQMPDKRLIVIGDGPDMERVRKISTPNIQILGYQTFDILRAHMQRARAFVFAAEEDFGIIPIEAQACGTPVIALGRGGCLETIQGNTETATGVFFPEQTVESIVTAVKKFDEAAKAISSEACIENAARFSVARFRSEFTEFVESAWNRFAAEMSGPQHH